MKTNLALLMAASGLLLEAGGPVQRKKTLADYDREEAEREARREEQRERNRQELAQQLQVETARLALTTNAEWARIKRDAQRRADKKAAKKQK